jgi:hypothetical protein
VAQFAGSFKNTKIGNQIYNPGVARVLGDKRTGEVGLVQLAARSVRSRVANAAAGAPLSRTGKIAVGGTVGATGLGLMALQSKRNSQQHELKQAQALAQIGQAAASGAFPQDSGEGMDPEYKASLDAKERSSSRKAQIPLQAAKVKADAQVEVARIRAGISDGKSSRSGTNPAPAANAARYAADRSVDRQRIATGGQVRVADINQKGAIAKQQIQSGGQVRVADINQKGAIAKQQVQTGGQVRVADINQRGAVDRQRIATGGQVRVADINSGRSLQGKMYEADSRRAIAATQAGGQARVADINQKGAAARQQIQSEALVKQTEMKVKVDQQRVDISRTAANNKAVLDSVAANNKALAAWVSPQEKFNKQGREDRAKSVAAIQKSQAAIALQRAKSDDEWLMRSLGLK